MIEPEVTIVINEAPGEVFRFVTHVENNPQWIRGAHVINLSEGAFGDGTLFQQDHIVVKVSHFQVNQGFETESIRIHLPTRLVLKHTHGRVQIEPVGQGTQLTLQEKLELRPFLKPFEHLFVRKAQQEIQAALEQLKALLEQKQG